MSFSVYKKKANIYWVFSMCQELSKHFTRVKSFHCHNNPMGLISFLAPFYRRVNWGTERFKCQAQDDIYYALQMRVGTTSCLPSRRWAVYIMGPHRVCEGEVGFTALMVISLVLPVLGFMTYIVEPLFREWARFTGNSTLSENMLSHLAHNKAQWKSLLPKQHRSSSGGSGGGSPDHTDHGTENEEQTVTEDVAP